MSISLIIGLAAIFFIVGILFIVKGVSTDGEQVVPISTPQEIEELKNTFTPNASMETDSYKDQIIPQVSSLSVNPTIDREQKAQIEKVREENEQLRSQVSEQKQKLGHLEQNLEILKREYANTKDVESDKIKLLEERVDQARIEKEQLMENQKLIDELKAKGALFKQQHLENQSLQAEMKEFIKQLEVERDELVKSKSQVVDKSELNVLGNRLSGSIDALEALKEENKNLLEVNRELKENFKQTGTINEQLLAKEKLMQFELVKNRAQVLGLGKICEDFKIQIETLSAPAKRY